MRFINFSLVALMCTVAHAAHSVSVRAIADDLRITLSDDTTLILADVVHPQPYATNALASLRDEWLNQPVTLTRLGTSRYGETIGYIHNAGGELLQDALLRSGAAMAYSASAHDETQRLVASYATPAMWQIDQSDTGDAMGHYRMVSGTVTDVAALKSATYINFADDWKTDFTIYVPKKIAKKLSATWPDLTTLTGKKLQVRGFIHSFYGPRITLHNPQMLSVTED